MKRKYLIVIMTKILILKNLIINGKKFAARLAQAKLAIKADIDGFVEKTDFEDKLKNLNKKVTSNKTEYVEAEKKLIDLRNKVAQISEKGYGFC